VSIKDVSTILGHSTVAITADIYTHTLRDDSISAMTRLADRLEAVC
jgi:integrase